MKYVYPTDRLRPWFGLAVGLAALVGMLAFGILGRNFGTLEHLKALNDAGSWLTVSLIEASAGILALLLAAVALGERIERGGGGTALHLPDSPYRSWGLRHHSASRLVRCAEDHLHFCGPRRVGGWRPHRGANSAIGHDDRGFRVHVVVVVGDAKGDVRGGAGERPGGERSEGKPRRPLLALAPSAKSTALEISFPANFRELRSPEASCREQAFYEVG